MPSLSLIAMVIAGLLICTLLVTWVLLGFELYHKARAYGFRRGTSLTHAIFGPILGSR